MTPEEIKALKKEQRDERLKIRAESNAKKKEIRDEVNKLIEHAKTDLRKVKKT